MTTLEKVAKAVCEKLFGPFDLAELNLPSSVSAQSMMATRAALESIRTPSRHMIEEANKRRGGAEHAADSRIRMLDAILNEKEG